MINFIVRWFLIHLSNFCILEEFTEILNIEKVVKEDEVKEEHMSKVIQRTFLHILQELYIIIQYTQTFTFRL